MALFCSGSGGSQLGLVLTLGALYGNRALKYEAGAKVLGAYVFVRSQCGRGALLKDSTLVQQVGAVCDSQGLTHVVVRDDYANILVFKLGDNELDIFYGDRVNAGEGLVQKDELRVARARAISQRRRSPPDS